MNPPDDSGPPVAAELTSELDALRARIKALELGLSEADDRFEALTDGLQVGVIIQGPSAEILFINPKAVELLGQSREQLMGKTSFDPTWNIVDESGSTFHGHDRPVATVFRRKEPVRDVLMGIDRPAVGDRVWLLVSAMPQFEPDAADVIKQVVSTFTDVTALRGAEEIMRAQSAMIEELSTPLLPITDDVMVMPLVGPIDRARGARIMATLLPGLSRSAARVAILDITGVPFMDRYAAASLVQVTLAAKLLGVQVILTGIQPSVAQNLASLDVDLSAVVTRPTLQRGIASALARHSRDRSNTPR